MKSYSELLAGRERLGFIERKRLQLLHDSAYCNPQVAVTPGRTPLLAVSGEAGRVYVLRRDGVGVDFAGSAAQALERARGLTRESLGALKLGPAQELKAQLIGCEDGGDQLPLQGPSFGLSMVLGLLSARLARPLPRDLAASAVVERGGQLRAVDGLPAKLRALRAWTPLVQRVLVAEEQPECPHPGVELVRVRSLAGAVNRAFSAPLDTLICQGMDAAQAQAMARQVFEQCVIRDPTLLSWRVLYDVASQLLERDDLGARGHDHALLAQAVAGRHCNENLELSAQLIERLPSGLRLRLYAQQVQALADSANPQWRDFSRRARGLLEAGLPCADHAGLLGALGRLHAAWGELEQAREDLERALRLWEELYEPARGSRAFCELLRVCALLGDAAPTEGHWWLAKAPYLDPNSLSYVRLARGRAWAILGHPKVAGPMLRELIAEPALPAHVRGTALRTLWEMDAEAEHLEQLRALCCEDASLGFNLNLVATVLGQPPQWSEGGRLEHARAVQVWGEPHAVLRAWRY